MIQGVDIDGRLRRHGPGRGRRRLLAAAGWLLAASLPAAEPERPEIPRQVRFEHLTNRDGLSQNTVFAIQQDRLGFMWFGTKVGLNRYDGYGFKIFTHDPYAPGALSEGFVRVLLEDRSGAMWIGTYGGGLDRFDPVTETFEHHRHDPNDPGSLSDDDVRAIWEDRSGTLWVGTRGGGLNRFEARSQTFARFQRDFDDRSSLSHNDVRAIAEDGSGRLWVGTFGGGLNRLEPGTPGSAAATFVRYRHDRGDPASLIDNRVRAICPDGEGKLWIGTNGGLDRFDPATESFTHFRHDPSDPESLSDDRVRAIYSDSAGRLWVGTRAGLDLFDPTTGGFVHYRKDPARPRSLSGESAYSIHEDSSGGLWVGTYNGGLSRLDPGAESFTHYRHDPSDPGSLSADEVSAIHAGTAVWIGTFGGGLNRFDRQAATFTRYRHDRARPRSLADDRVSCVLEDRSGRLWVGMYDHGLSRFDAATEDFAHFRHDPQDPGSLSRDYVRAVFEDRTGRLWIGTQGGGLDRFDPATGGFVHHRHDPQDPDSLGHDSVVAVAEDSAGALWVGTYGGGLDRFDPATGRFTHFRHDPRDPGSLSHDAVSAIYEDRSRELWVGTYGGGLDRFDPATGGFVHYAGIGNLVDNAVLGILEDRLGRLWLSTNRGLTRFDPRAGQWTTYDVRDGLQDVEFNPGAFHQSREGEMFFGGNGGFNAFFPERFTDNTFVPPVVVTSFKVFEKEVTGPSSSAYVEEIELSWEDNFFSFEFAALSFRRPDKNRYLYRLEGLDVDWVDPWPRRYASYTKVPPGEYVFRLRGSNNDGAWNHAGTSVRILITPPWWKTPAFYVLEAILASALVFGAFLFQRRRLQRHEAAALQALDLRRKRQELATAEEWARELEEKNRQLEEKNQQILLAQTQLVQSEKMASLGQLVAGVAHEINNPVSFVSSGLPALRRDLDRLAAAVPEELRDEAYAKLRERIASLVGVIEEGARRTSEIVRNLRTFSRLDEATLKAVDLHEALDTTLSLLESRTRNRILVVRRYGEIPPVMCYGSQINQVLMNVMLNAVQAIEGEGTLTLVTRRSGEDRVEVSIRDTGCGMTEAVRRKIFDPFFTTRPVGEGTGLGLSISHGILEQHGASIEIESRHGEGTEVSITLPIRASAAATADRPAAALRSPG